MAWAAAVASILSSAQSQGQQAAGSPWGPMHRVTSYGANSFQPNALPDVATLIAARERGFLDARTAGLFLHYHGAEDWLTRNPTSAHEIARAAGLEVNPWRDAWRAVAKLQQARLTPEDTLVAVNRGIYSEAKGLENLKEIGFTDPFVADDFLKLRFAIPGSSDLIMMAVKEAWDEETVALFQYDADFPPEFAYWMDKQGFNGDARTEEQRYRGDPVVRWPQLYWRAHWYVISPTQAYEMFQRLRPERIDRFRDTLPNVQPFTLRHLRTVLKVHDYPVPFRDQLAAIAYHKPRLVDIRRMRCDGTISYEEMTAKYLDYGYSPSDAKQMADWTERYCAQQNRKKLGIDPQKAVLDAYCRKLLSREQAAVQLYRYKTALQERGRIWQGLPLNQQIEEALGDPEVKAALENTDFQCWLKLTDKRIKRIRMRYQRGQWGYSQTARQLRELGIQTAEVPRLIDEWDDELSAGKLMVSTGKIRELIVKQLLPVPLAMRWLANLGWQEPELNYLIAEAQRDLNLEIAKQQERMAKTLAARQKAQMQQLKILERERRQAEAAIMRTLTPAMAKKYFVRGHFSEPQLRATLAKWRYAGVALEAFVTEAKQERRDYLERKERQRCLDQRRGDCAPDGKPAKEPEGEEEEGTGNGTLPPSP